MRATLPLQVGLAAASTLVLTLLLRPESAEAAALLPLAPLLVAPLLLTRPKGSVRLGGASAVTTWVAVLLLLTGRPLGESLLLGVANGAEALVVAVALSGRQPSASLATVRDLGRLFAVAAAGAVTAGLLVLAASAGAEGPQLGLEAALGSTASHGLALLVLLPLGLTTTRHPGEAGPRERRLHDGVLLISLLPLITVGGHSELLLAPVAVLVGSALRCAFGHVLRLYAVTAWAAGVATVAGKGPFALQGSLSSLVAVETYLLFTGFIVLCVGVSVDERRVALRDLSELVRIDPLTGLGNRRLLEERLDALMVRARRGIPSTLLVLDLDRFKAVNDAEGHGAGDRTLRSVAQRLLELTRAVDTVVRTGGDEFAVLLEGVTCPSVEADGFIARIRDAVDRPTPGVSGRVSASVGAAAVDPGRSRQALLAAADAQMYERKGARHPVSR